MREVGNIGVAGGGKTTRLLNDIQGENFLKISVTCMYDSGQKVIIERLGWKERKLGFRTPWGLATHNLLWENVISWKQQKFLDPTYQERYLKALGRKFGLKYYQSETLESSIDTLNGVLSALQKAVNIHQDIDIAEKYLDHFFISPDAKAKGKRALKYMIEKYKKGEYYHYIFLFYDAVRLEINIFRYHWKRRELIFEKAFVDEAQDLPPIFYRFLELSELAEVYYYGDPAQMIFSWTGATDKFLLKAKEKKFFTQTRRFGNPLCKVLNKLLRRIGYDWEIKPAPHTTFYKQYLGEGTDADMLLINKLVNKAPNPVILARTNYLAYKIRSDLINRGFVALPIKRSEEDKLSKMLDFFELYLKYKQTGDKKVLVQIYEKMTGEKIQGLDVLKIEKWKQTMDFIKDLFDFFKVRSNRNLYFNLINNMIKGNKKVFVDTYHAVKGQEYDYVIVYDMLTKRILDAIDNKTTTKEDELRNLFVALSRARRGVFHVITPTSVFSI